LTDSDYVLRPRDQEEIARLELQHRVWKEPTDRVVSRAGFSSGDQLLDLGCGPGYLTLDLARVTGDGGRVHGVDASEHFVAHLDSQIAKERITNVQTSEADLKALDVGVEKYDGAICRWVLMFIDQPERVLQNVVRALKPGGTFVVMEYFQFKSISLWPNGKHFRQLYDAVFELITRSGGNPNLGSRVPGLVCDAGFEIIDLIPILRVGRPNTPMWDWMTSHNQNHTNLVEAGLLSEDQLQAYYHEFEEHSKNPSAFFTAPPVLATIARKV
jgi:ubiquinone/menaquinone biosynthesis C-methylase UbiE